MGWFLNIIRILFFQIDNIVYGLISVLYELIMYLANLDLFGISNMLQSDGFHMDPNNLIFKFASRIYVLLGVIMLFQIAFAILQYIVDPNAFSDKGKGMGKLVTNCLISLVLVVTVPFIFAFAYKVQSTILSSNILGKIILGNSVGNNVESMNGANKMMATDMQFLVFGTFASIDESTFYGICNSGPVLGTKAMVQAQGTYDGAENTPCLDKVDEKLMKDSNIGYFFRTTDNPDEDQRDFSKYGDIINVKDDQGVYYINYRFIISTIVGVVIVLLLINTALEIAVRAIKLAFLEIIAPIPIISYMNPLLSKANSMLGKWGKECLSTFASLFIRLAVIYFVFFMVDAITNTLLATGTTATYANGDTPSGWMAILVQVMVIIGLLIFASQIPNLIESIIGIKMSGNFSLNPLKTITQSPIAAGVLGGAVGGAVAGLGGLAANALAAKNTFQHQRDLGHGVLRSTASTFGSIVGGAGSGLFRGGLTGVKSKNAIEGMKKGVTSAVNARMARDTKQQVHYGVKDRVGDKIAKFAGLPNEYGGFGKLDEKQKGLERELKNAQQDEDAIRQALADLESRGPAVADRRNMDMANYELSKVMNSFGDKDYNMAANSSSWDDYNNKLNEAYANAKNEEEQNSIIERAMNRSQYDQFIEAQNFANMQRKAYNDEQQQYQDDYKRKVEELTDQRKAADEKTKDLEMQINDYKRVSNPDAAPGGRRRSSNNSGVRPGGSLGANKTETTSNTKPDLTEDVKVTSSSSNSSSVKPVGTSGSSSSNATPRTVSSKPIDTNSNNNSLGGNQGLGSNNNGINGSNGNNQ